MQQWQLTFLVAHLPFSTSFLRLFVPSYPDLTKSVKFQRQIAKCPYLEYMQDHYRIKSKAKSNSKSTLFNYFDDYCGLLSAMELLQRKTLLSIKHVTTQNSTDTWYGKNLVSWSSWDPINGCCVMPTSSSEDLFSSNFPIYNHFTVL